MIRTIINHAYLGQVGLDDEQKVRPHTLTYLNNLLLRPFKPIVLAKYKQDLISVHQRPQVNATGTQRLNTEFSGQPTVQLDLNLRYTINEHPLPC